MNAGDRGLTRHAIRCNSNIAWEKSKIVEKERGWTQRKFLAKCRLGCLPIRLETGRFCRPILSRK